MRGAKHANSTNNMSAHRYLCSFLLCCFTLSGLLFFSTVAAARRRRTMIGCTTSERDALIDYKAGINDTYGRLSSWTIHQDCCRWSGVVCHNQTTNGQVHVVRLNLQNPYDVDDPAFQHAILKGEMLSSSLLSLTHLEGLNLSRNNLGGVQIPDLVGSLHKLRYLDLRWSNFGGKIPHHLGNLSNLRYLDLNSEGNTPGPHADSLDWLSGLSYLTYLDMSNVNLSAVSQYWLTVMNTLPSLQQLALSGCNLNHLPSSLSHLNLTALNSLILIDNNFNSTLPNWLWNLTTLSTLNLMVNSQIHGTIPIAIGNLANLMHLYLGNSLSGPLPAELWSLVRLELLDLGGNYLFGGHIPNEIGNLSSLSEISLYSCSLCGPIPAEIGNLTSLEILYLGYNSLTSSIPLEINKLSNLKYFDLSGNSLEGVLSQLHLTNSTRLQYLCLSDNHLLNIAIDETWVPPFQLHDILLDSCKLGPSFPRWIRSQQTIIFLLLSNGSIEDALPDWFWNFSSYLSAVDLSQNKITGALPSSFENMERLDFLDLHNNLLEGSVPQLPPNMGAVDLSNNLLSGPLISLNFPNTLVLSNNHIVGSIPPSICLSNQLEIIDLSNNLISGQIPSCNWQEAENLIFIHLGNNTLTGKIPSSLGSLTSIMSLHLNNNTLHGSIPSALQNCSRLRVFDLGDNNFSEQIPTWIGQSWQELTILRLHSNMFYGNIPPQLGQLSKLQIIDLANNHLVGPIPYTLGNLSAIISTSTTMDRRQVSEEAVTLDIKGYAVSISITLYLFKSIDLSNNSLTGEIPSSLGSLTSIMSLHLNNNNLHGRIPSSLQNCNGLLVFDLGDNKFSGQIPAWIGQRWQELAILRLHSNMFYGKIPPQLGQLSKLQIIDLANNHLVGPIPYTLGSLSAIISTSTTMDRIQVSEETVTLDIKGYEVSISKTLYLFKSIDLSNNRLSGEIPRELGSLVGLQTLNLSRNYFTSKIPNTIGGMKSLETLDLSFNNLSGVIPQGLAMLSSLNHLNLSYNNLSGTIPTGNQLQTLQDGSIYIGNPYLCGAPTINSCFPINNNDVMDEAASNLMPNYLPATLGFLVGLWSVFVIILFKRDWRHFYFRVIDKVYNKAYVVIKLRMKRK